MTRHVAFLFVLIASLTTTDELRAQRVQERTLTLSERQLDSALKKKGRFPTNIEAAVVRNRPTFRLTYMMSDTTVEWDLAHGMTDQEFAKQNQSNAQKKLKIVAHHEYTVKEEKLHVALWHFDKDFQPPKETESFGESEQPPAKPLDIVWRRTDEIPITGSAVPAFAPLDKMAVDLLRANQLPGVSIAVFYDGKPIYARAFGYADIATKSALRPDQPMRMFEMSKIITSAAIMQLIDGNQLEMDETVWDLLKLDEPKDPAFKKITIRNLLEDTGGFAQELSFNPMQKPRRIASELKLVHPIKKEAVIQYMLQQPLDFEPGKKQAESDFGYFLLGRVIEKVTKMEYEEYVKKNLLEPLNIQSMQLGKSVKEDRSSSEPSYYERTGMYTTQIAKPENVNQWVQIPNGGIHMDLHDSWGGWISTPTDLMILANAIRTTKRSPILSPAAIKQIFAKPTGIKVGQEYMNNGWSQRIFDAKRSNSFKYGEDYGTSGHFLCRYDNFSWAFIFNCDMTKDKQEANRKGSTMIFEAMLKAKKNLGL